MLNDFLLEEVWWNQNHNNLLDRLSKALKTVKYVGLNPYDTVDDDDENNDPNITVVQVQIKLVDTYCILSIIMCRFE